jgi:hypothetical protein
MYSKARVCIFFLLACVIGQNGCAGRGNAEREVIAEVGEGYRITFPELREYTVGGYLEYIYPDQLKAYETGLNQMILGQLKLLDFFARDLHENDEVMQGIRRIVNEELVIRYFEREFLGKHINEQSIAGEYEQMSREVVYRQILLPKPDAAPSAVLESMREMVDGIQSDLEAGESFASLASRYSRDAEAVRRGGYMPPLTWNNLRNPIQQLIFRLEPGEIRSYETRNAFYIVQVERVNEISVAPFEEVRDEIEKTMRQRYFQESYNEFESEKKRYIDEGSLEWNYAALAQIVEWSNQRNFYQVHYQDTLRRAVDEGRNFTIVSHRDGNVDLEEFNRLLNDISIIGGGGNVGIDAIKDYLLDALRTDVLVQRALELDLEKEILHPYTTNAVLRNRIVRLYDAHVIEPRVPEATDASLRRFYEEQKDSLFYQLPVVNTLVLLYSDADEARAQWRRIEDGAAFEDLASRWYVKSYIRDRGGNIDSHRSTEEPFLGEVAFGMEVGEVLGPVEYYDPAKGTQYAIVKCAARRPEKQLTYDEVSERIQDEFTKFHRALIGMSVEKELRETFPVHIYIDNLKYQLTEKELI